MGAVLPTASQLGIEIMLAAPLRAVVGIALSLSFLVLIWPNSGAQAQGNQTWLILLQGPPVYWGSSWAAASFVYPPPSNGSSRSVDLSQVKGPNGSDQPVFTVKPNNTVDYNLVLPTPLPPSQTTCPSGVPLSGTINLEASGGPYPARTRYSGEKVIHEWLFAGLDSCLGLGQGQTIVLRITSSVAGEDFAGGDVVGEARVDHEVWRVQPIISEQQYLLQPGKDSIRTGSHEFNMGMAVPTGLNITVYPNSRFSLYSSPNAHSWGGKLTQGSAEIRMIRTPGAEELRCGDLGNCVELENLAGVVHIRTSTIRDCQSGQTCFCVVSTTNDTQGSVQGPVTITISVPNNCPAGAVVAENNSGDLIPISPGTPVTLSGPQPSVVAGTHDFNADGRSDILWHETSGNTAVWLMNGAQPSSSALIGTVDPAWSIVGQRDFDGNGKADLLWRNNSGLTAVWLMNGAQIASSAVIGQVGLEWSVVGTGDFTADGNGDILWRHSSGLVAIWSMNGTQPAQTAVLGNVSLSWTVAGTADFNADGKSDILWRDENGTVAIWLMNGLQIHQTGVLGTIPIEWKIAATGDFDGDGRSDFLWRHRDSGALAIWLIKGLQIVRTESIGSVSDNWVIAKTGDFDGDRKSDILWRNTTTGDVALWLMSGLQISSTASLGQIPIAWSVQGLNAN